MTSRHAGAQSAQALNRIGGVRWGRVALIGAAFVAIYFAGQHVADTILSQFGLVMHVRSEPMIHRLIMTASGIYIALMSVPFMPAAEIGISMILVFGAKISFLVYVCTVAALIPPYLIGRLIPMQYCARLFAFLGLRKAHRLLDEIAPLTAEQRLAYLVENTPHRFGPFLLRHRFLALAAVLNLPGNMVIGGGGGIAMLAGMTGLYSLPAYLSTVMIAVAPVPLLVSLTEIGS